MNLPDHLCSDPDDEFETTRDLLTRRAKYFNSTLDRFWKRWRSEYLLDLRESHRHHRGIPEATRVSVGDVVVIHSDDQPRGFWKLGRVEETVSGPDGEPRGAVLQVASKGRSATCLNRPVQRLYPLEVTGTGVSQPDLPDSDVGPILDEDNPNVDEDASTSTPPTRRPQRAAAFKARDRLKALVLSDD